MDIQQQHNQLFDNQLWSVERLSKYLDVPVGTVRDWIFKGKVPLVRVGRHVRFKPSDIETWLKKRSFDCP